MPPCRRRALNDRCAALPSISIGWVVSCYPTHAVHSVTTHPCSCDLRTRCLNVLHVPVHQSILNELVDFLRCGIEAGFVPPSQPGCSTRETRKRRSTEVHSGGRSCTDENAEALAPAAAAAAAREALQAPSLGVLRSRRKQAAEGTGAGSNADQPQGASFASACGSASLPGFLEVCYCCWMFAAQSLGECSRAKAGQ